MLVLHIFSFSYLVQNTPTHGRLVPLRREEEKEMADEDFTHFKFLQFLPRTVKMINTEREEGGNN